MGNTLCSLDVGSQADSYPLAGPPAPELGNVGYFKTAYPPGLATALCGSPVPWEDGKGRQHTAATEGQEPSLGSEKVGSLKGFKS